MEGNINYYPGHMAKTKKQIIEDLKLIDIIIEVLDARIPNSSRNRDLEKYTEGKKKIIVLNKADLADANITNSWKKKFDGMGIKTVIVEANNKKGLSELINLITTEGNEILKSYKEKGRIGRTIRAMIIGIPNVGKSTLINGLANKNVLRAENRPGVTKSKQWLKINEHVELMDTPGMLWPKISNDIEGQHLAFTNSIGQNALDNEEIAFLLLDFLLNNYSQNIMKRYSLSDLTSTYEVLELIAKKTGALLSGGRIDEMKVSNIILNDFRSGKLGRISLEKPEI